MDNYDEIKINNLKMPYITYKRIAKHIRKGYTVEDTVLREIMNFAVEEIGKDMVEKTTSLL
jgi:hypothetical protein